MLNLFYYEMEEQLEDTGLTFIQYPSGYFDSVYEKSYLNSDLAREITKGIDLTEYIGDEVYKSPALGMISPRDLSSGCKGVLLLLAEDNIVIPSHRFGDNCGDWIIEVSKTKDIYLTITHYLDFSDKIVFRDARTGEEGKGEMGFRDWMKKNYLAKRKRDKEDMKDGD